MQYHVLACNISGARDKRQTTRPRHTAAASAGQQDRSKAMGARGKSQTTRPGDTAAAAAGQQDRCMLMDVC